jgi:23S rRNA pseudouridine2457 synthase
MKCNSGWLLSFSFNFSLSFRSRSVFLLLVFFFFLHSTSTVVQALELSNRRQDKQYIALYKPALTLCSLEDDTSRAERKHRDRRLTLADLALPLTNGSSRSSSGGSSNSSGSDTTSSCWHTVGRLDRDSEGLLLLTNDGSFTSQVHEQCAKRYWVLVKGEQEPPSEEAMDKLRQGGFVIRGVTTRAPLGVELLSASDEPSPQLRLLPPAVPGMDRPGFWLEIVLDEGRHRQIRRMTAAVGHPTIRLVRVAVGAVCLDGLQPGEWRYIEKKEDAFVELSNNE